MNLYEEQAQWVNSEQYALELRDRFNSELMGDTDLWKHREFSGPRGMGEDCFHWMWKLIVDELPSPFRFMEVGVFKGQVLSLVRLLAHRTNKPAVIYGVTMLNRFAGSRDMHPDCDYAAEIKEMHNHFDQGMPILIVGDSTSQGVHDRIEEVNLFDAIYIDACHDYDYVMKDLLFYSERIKVGGFLITDDSANNLKQPFGFFQGIEDVTRAVLTLIATSHKWEHVITVVHNRVWRKVE